MLKKKRGRKMLIGLGSFLGIYFIVCFVLAWTYLHPPRQVMPTPADLSDVMIPTDGGPDPAFVTPGLAQSKASPVVFIFAHGYGGDRSGWTDLMSALEKQGYESIAPAMPGQDASPESTVGFGPKEAKVLVNTVAWVRQHALNKPKIVLVGVSMGGAAAWLASEMDPSVDGVITEGAYARFDEAMKGWFEGRAPGSSVYLRPVVWFASWMSGGKPSDIRPVEAAAKWKGRPALVIHGDADTLMPLSFAQQLSSAAGCELWRVRRATHAHCVDVAGPEYVKRLVVFAEALPGKTLATSPVH